ncbi:MAG: ComEC/Rec2 family competence protein [Rhodospirillales bacterium]|nr:ComEC/Rec2 family competence protein [Rhodospirillales bacterium]
MGVFPQIASLRAASPHALARVIAAAFAAEHDRWILWLPVLVGCGIAIHFWLPFEPVPWLGLMACALLLAAGRGGTAGGAGRRLVWLIALGAVAVGFTAAQVRTMMVSAPVLSEKIGPTGVEGRIVRAERSGARTRLTLDRVAIERVAVASTPERVRISLGGDQPSLAPGDRVRTLAVLSPPAAPTAPGAFDFQRQSFFAGLGATGFGLGQAEVLRRDRRERDIALAGLRAWIETVVHRSVAAPEAAVIVALLTGERAGIPPPVLAAIRDAGLAHLLAISGLHIGLVAAFLFTALRTALCSSPALSLRRPIKKWAAVAALIGAGGYAVIAGATIPSQRAFIMVAVVFLGVIFDRQAISMRLVAVAATAVLLAQPESLLGASFQLSFAAVVALIAVYDMAQHRRFGDPGDGLLARGLTYLAFVALTTVVATVATAPFALFHFQRLAIFGLPANLVSVPLMALWIMPFGVAALLAMPLGLSAPFLVAMGWGVGAVIATAETVAGWPGAVALLPAMPLFGLAALSFGGLWLCLWRGRWRYAGGSLIVAGLVGIAIARPPDILVDGHARMIGVRTPDGGLALSQTRAARFEQASWLRRAGLREASPWAGATAGGSAFIRCDGSGCTVEIKERTVALMLRADAAADDCRIADILISLVPVPGACPSPRVIVDRFDLWRNGAHAIWLNANGAEVRSVNGLRGNRPWVLRPDEIAKKRRSAQKPPPRTALGRDAGPGPATARR